MGAYLKTNFTHLFRGMPIPSIYLVLYSQNHKLFRYFKMCAIRFESDKIQITVKTSDAILVQNASGHVVVLTCEDISRITAMLHLLTKKRVIK